MRPIELMFNVYRRKVLALLLLRPERTFYVREISRLTQVPTGSVHRELRALHAAGLLSRTAAGNQVLYQADPSCPIYPELSTIFRKTMGLADPLKDALAPLKKEIHCAFLFGSVAREKERSSSDIDLFVIGTLGLRQIVAALIPLQDQLGREINPIVMSPDEFLKQVRTNAPFVKRVMGEPKIFLIGGENDLGEPGPDRPAEGASV